MRNVLISAIIRTLMAFALAVIACSFIEMLCSCRAHRETETPLPVVPIETTTETKIIHTETIDTVFIEIPAQSAERTTPDKFSHLETDYAESDARINEDGTLTHTLANKPLPKAVPIKNSTDTIYIDRNIEVPIPVEVPKEVERQLTTWQQVRLSTWGWLAATVALCAGWFLRKPLLTLAGRLLTKTT